MHDEDRDLMDPDHQMRLPFPEAEDYARQVMRWSRDLATDSLDVRRDVAYGSHRLHRYDVFGPRGARNAPVVVFWHGGGWTNGYRSYVSFMAPHLARLGCVLVAPSYRLAPADKLPAAYEDSLAALRHIIEHAEAYGADARRIHLAGHSAGAHLATLVALRQADRQRAGIPHDAIRACLPISGIMDLHHPQPAAGSLEERIYSMVLRDGREDAVMSPLCWASGNTVPICLSFGEFDSARVRLSNQRLAALLAQQPGMSSEFMEPGLDHFGTHTALQNPDAPWYRRLGQFLRGAQR
ncbi:alpha/beta hydrolase [Variovorax sp. YR216]|uniref:alpha/beta hydrolase n=1 Tax=Variovorax sp. YR216 TaxID=1882828 RepID=UPI0015A2CA69|nr:alpha/beta fold hydrolase [Variovorax sp. YR216]